MISHRVRFAPHDQEVQVPTGTLLSEAARQAGIELMQPCGGQGRCGRCAVLVKEGAVRRRSTLRLSKEDIEAGWALACQSVVEGDLSLLVPPQEKVERRLTTDLTAVEVQVPAGYSYLRQQSVQRVPLSLTPPDMDNQTDDLARLLTAIRQKRPEWKLPGFDRVHLSLPLLRNLGSRLRQSDWKVTPIVSLQPAEDGLLEVERLVDVLPGLVPEDQPLWGLAIDIGTTTVTVWLVDLVSGKVRAQVSEYNGQIARGEDIISRIVFSNNDGGGKELRQLVLDTIHSLVDTACKRVKELHQAAGGSAHNQIVKAAIAGNSTMMHLLLGIPASSIRLSPFVTAANHLPSFTAREIGLQIHPDATVDCLPGVASYVGADITAGVLSSGMDDTDRVTLFMDVGTNGEIVLGTREWLVTCACSAGPAFEGGGVLHGMRATRGAIEEVWINAENSEPSCRVIGGGKPRGLCGSGLISLLAEMFLSGIVDKAGNLNAHLPTERIRDGEHGMEYVLAWAADSEIGKDIAITRVDIDNLLRAKGAIYAGYSVLSESVGVPMEAIEQMLIGGSFGKYINVEKAVQIGLLPDLPWERFQFLGNTSVRGAYHALLRLESRQRVRDIAARMTYIELSADNTFYDAFMSALFLPHTDLSRFPSVEAALNEMATR